MFFALLFICYCNCYSDKNFYLCFVIDSLVPIFIYLVSLYVSPYVQKYLSSYLYLRQMQISRNINFFVSDKVLLLCRTKVKHEHTWVLQLGSVSSTIAAAMTTFIGAEMEIHRWLSLYKINNFHPRTLTPLLTKKVTDVLLKNWTVQFSAKLKYRKKKQSIFICNGRHLIYLCKISKRRTLSLSLLNTIQVRQIFVFELGNFPIIIPSCSWISFVVISYNFSLLHMPESPKIIATWKVYLLHLHISGLYKGWYFIISLIMKS